MWRSQNRTGLWLFPFESHPGPHVHWIYSNYLRTGRGVIMKIDSNRELKSPGFGRCVFHSCRGVPISQCNGFTNVHYNFSVFSNASVSSTAEGGGGWVRGGCFKIRGSVGGEGGGGNGLFWTSDRSPGATTTEERELYLPTVIIIRGILTAIQTILNLRTKNAARIFA